jgi:ankyrin repeat protein
LTKLLIDNGANVNAKNANGQSSLVIAVGKENPEITKLLIERGADVNVESKSGFTPLHWATYRGLYPIVELLLAANACRTFTCCQCQH